MARSTDFIPFLWWASAHGTRSVLLEQTSQLRTARNSSLKHDLSVDRQCRGHENTSLRHFVKIRDGCNVDVDPGFISCGFHVGMRRATSRASDAEDLDLFHQTLAQVRRRLDSDDSPALPLDYISFMKIVAKGDRNCAFRVTRRRAAKRARAARRRNALQDDNVNHLSSYGVGLCRSPSSSLSVPARVMSPLGVRVTRLRGL